MLPFVSAGRRDRMVTYGCCALIFNGRQDACSVDESSGNGVGYEVGSSGEPRAIIFVALLTKYLGLRVAEAPGSDVRSLLGSLLSARCER